MIDTKELRRLAQAATPGPWVATTVVTSIGVCHKVGPFPGKTTEHPPRHACLYVDYESADNPADREIYANASFIAAANPAAISELLDRLEAAEKERDALRVKAEAVESDAAHQKTLAESALRVAEGWERKCDALRAKVERMEQQGPVEWQTRTRPAWNDGTWGPWRKCSEEYAEDIKKTPLLHDWLYEARALYALPGAKGEEK